jgi:hypothetical protein
MKHQLHPGTRIFTWRTAKKHDSVDKDWSASTVFPNFDPSFFKTVFNVFPMEDMISRKRMFLKDQFYLPSWRRQQPVPPDDARK